MANKLEYILSGCSFTRLTFRDAYENLENKQWTFNEFEKMQNRGPNHGFSLLYNAWGEKDFGRVIKDNYEDALVNIMGDSGGLQIVTRGKQLTEDLKQQVYNNQAKYTSMAMSFDEIPVGLSGEKSSRLDLGTRYFDKENFERCAKASGQNIKNQILTFDKLGSKSKPILIIQGNGLDTYIKWCELLINEVPVELRDRIGGIAMGGAALGHGKLEDIKRAFYFSQLPFDATHNHMHLLGIGAVTRILPYIVFMQNGLFNDLYFTYDSTTHSSGAQMGRYYMEDSALEFPRHLDPYIWPKMYENIKKYVDYDLSLETFHKALNTASKVFASQHGDRMPVIQSFMALILGAVTNFIMHVEKCFDSKKEVLKLANKQKLHLVFESLYNVKTLDDFHYWEHNIGQYINTNPVKSEKPNSLEEFFGDD